MRVAGAAVEVVPYQLTAQSSGQRPHMVPLGFHGLCETQCHGDLHGSVGRQGGCEHKRARTIYEEPLQHRRSADERPHAGQCLTTGFDNRQSLALQPEFCNQPGPRGDRRLQSHAPHLR